MRSSSVIENQVEKIAVILRATDEKINKVKENLAAIDKAKEKENEKDKEKQIDSLYLKALNEVSRALNELQENKDNNAPEMGDSVNQVLDSLNTYKGAFTLKTEYEDFLRSIYVALFMDKNPNKASLTELINDQFATCMKQSVGSASSLKFTIFGKAHTLLDELKNKLLMYRQGIKRDFSVMGIEDMGNMLATLEKIATQDAKGECELKNMINAKNGITLEKIHADPVLRKHKVTVPTGMDQDKDHKVQIQNKLNVKDTAEVNFVLFMHQQLAAAYQRSLEIAHGLNKPVNEIIYAPNMIQHSDILQAISTESKMSNLVDEADVALDAKRKGFTLNGEVISLSKESENDNDELKKEVKKAIEKFTKDESGVNVNGSRANKLFYFGGQWLHAIMGSEFAAQIAISFPNIDIDNTQVNISKGAGGISNWTIIKSNQEIIGKISYKVLSISALPADPKIPSLLLALGADGQSLMELNLDNEQHSGMVERLKLGREKMPHSVAPVAEIRLSVKLTEDPETKKFFIEPTGFEIKLNTTNLLSRKDLMLENTILQTPSPQPKSPKI